MFRKISEDLNLERLYDQKLEKTRTTNQTTQYTHLCYVSKTDMHKKVLRYNFVYLSTIYYYWY
jgi:hypothetical protein